jgi:hypothetical protein
MQSTQTRRRLLATLSSATAAALIGSAKVGAQEAPPETTTVRLTKIPGICVAPQYVAEELLKAEGFSDVQYVEVEAADVHAAFAAAKVDVSMAFVAPFIMQVEEPAPADDLQIGEVGLPKLVWGGRRIGEAIGRLHQDEGRGRDQAMVLQEPINDGFGHKAALRVREVDGEQPAYNCPDWIAYSCCEIT